MAIVDDRGRVAGRVNLIDALIAVFLLVLIPVGYGAYLLFRTPAPKLVGIAPTSIYQGSSQRIGISGRNLRPFMRISFDTVQGRTFLIGSTNFAAVDLPDLAPGTYDVVLFDYMQEVDRLKKALTILPLAPQPTVEMEVAGSFLYNGGPPITVGEKFPPEGDAVAEVLAVGPPVEADMRIRTGDVTVGVALPGYKQVPATLRLKCYTSATTDGVIRCSVQGPAAPAIVAPDSNLTLKAPNGWINFQISEAYPVSSPPLARARVVFLAAPAVVGKIKPGDTDTGPGANARGYSAKLTAIDAVGAASPGALARLGAVSPDARAVTATLQVPVLETSAGWTYKQQPLKIGSPFVFETREYVLRGEVADLTPPHAAAGTPQVPSSR
jgi:hypothetical protein